MAAAAANRFYYDHAIPTASDPAKTRCGRKEEEEY